MDWDIVNWSLALDFWEKKAYLTNKHLTCLELGGRRGGLSLWLALKGNTVVCSDLESPEEQALEIHQYYECRNLITYQAIDATDIPYTGHFDLVIFKSILGGVSRYERDDLKHKAIEQMHKALKKGGLLLFAENLESSFLHRWLRKRFAVWGDWNYLRPNEIATVFSKFEQVEYITIGFFGAFGRNENQRRFLGRLDRFFEKLVPKNKRYILVGIAKK